MPDTLKILLVDDDEDDFLLTSDYLNEIPNKKFKIDWAFSFDNALQKIKEKEYDVYFFDFRLGVKTGLDLLNEAMTFGCQQPIILLTGKGDRKVDEEATKLGAVDYLVKSELNAEILERSIRYGLDRANTLKSLKVSEQKFRAIFEQSPDTIFLIKPDGTFLELNPSATQLMGYSIQEIFSMKASSFWEKPESWNDFLEMMKTFGFVKNWEVALVSKDKERKTCLISAVVHKDNEDEIFFQGIIHDITNRKKAEKNQLVAEKMASTGRLATTLAHEVRNPLTNINLSVEELEAELTDESLIMYVEIIKRNSKRINDLINELLNSAKPSNISLEKHSIEKVVDDTLEMAVDRITLKNITLEKDYTAGDCLVLLLDEPKIKMALLNIIINAVEAMEENTGILKVSIHSPEEKCVVMIEDNGSGITQENMNRLFEPYFTSKQTGMGLGLAATLNILQSHKAEVEVSSEVGKGTKFVITFNL